MTEQLNQFLTFRLNEDVFALDISMVKEVIEFDGVTPVPNLPDYMMGVINLRGNVVPVWDLKKKFQLSESEVTVDTCVIIVETTWQDEEITLGVLADSVREVVDLNESEIEPPPKLGNKISVKYSSGMGKIGDIFCVVLNMGKILNEAELNANQLTLR